MPVKRRLNFMAYNPNLALVPRVAMPQVKSTLVRQFLAELAAAGVLVLRNRSLSRILKRSQREIHDETVVALMDKPEQLSKPIMVSKDLFVLDGHHRWAANARLGRIQEVWFIDAPAAEVLGAMARFAARHPEECGTKV